MEKPTYRGQEVNEVRNACGDGYNQLDKEALLVKLTNFNSQNGGTESVKALFFSISILRHKTGYLRGFILFVHKLSEKQKNP